MIGMSVCLFVSVSQKQHIVQTSPCMLLVVLLRRRCDTLYRSGRVDDVKFSHNVHYDTGDAGWT